MWRGSRLVQGRTTPYWSRRTIIALSLWTLVAAVLVCYLLEVWPARQMREWPTSVGTISEAHTVVRQYYNGERGSAVQFQPEIRVSYFAEGKNCTRWFALPARWDLNRSEMEKKAGELVGTKCQVHWRPRKPIDAYVTEIATVTR